MIDIADWLRAEAELVALDRLAEAADEIERLRAATLWRCEACGSMSRDGECDCTRMETGTQRLVPFDPKDMSDEIERLRSALERLQLELANVDRALEIKP